MTWLLVFLATKLHIVVVVAGVLLFFYSKFGQRRSLLKVGVITLPLAYIMGKIASALVNTPRPFVDGHMIQLIEHVPDNGFPSEHTLLAVTLGTIVYTQNRLVGSLLIILGVLVGVGRVLAGVHHFIDVLGSIVIAFLATYMAVLILRRLRA